VLDLRDGGVLFGSDFLRDDVVGGNLIMNKVLSRRTTISLYHLVDGLKVDGPSDFLTGTFSGLRGDCTGLRGGCTGLHGDCTGLRGDCTGLHGDCTGLSGDLDKAEISDQDVFDGVSIESLVL